MTRKNTNFEIVSYSVVFVKNDGMGGNYVVDMENCNSIEEVLLNLQIPADCAYFTIRKGITTEPRPHQYVLKTVPVQTFVIRDIEADQFNAKEMLTLTQRNNEPVAICIPTSCIDKNGYIHHKAVTHEARFKFSTGNAPKIRNRGIAHVVKFYSIAHIEFDDLLVDHPDTSYYCTSKQVESNDLQDIVIPSASQYKRDYVARYCKLHGLNIPAKDYESKFREFANGFNLHEKWQCPKFDVYDLVEEEVELYGRIEKIKYIQKFQRYQIARPRKNEIIPKDYDFGHCTYGDNYHGLYNRNDKFIDPACITSQGFIDLSRNIDPNK